MEFHVKAKKEMPSKGKEVFFLIQSDFIYYWSREFYFNLSSQVLLTSEAMERDLLIGSFHCSHAFFPREAGVYI
jgi:hypothetical protein